MRHMTSTFSMSASLRGVVASLQSELSRGQKELATGRRADPGVELGLRASRSVTLTQTQETIGAIRASNDLVSERLTSTQAALGKLLSDAKSMRQTLLASQPSGAQREALIAQARQSLSSFQTTLNASQGGAFLFSGIRTEAAPLSDYFSNPPSSGKTTLDTAFRNAFGFGQSDPGVASISVAQMQSFLTGDFTALFSQAGWRAGWSKASDQPLTSQIGPSNVIDSSITANEPGMKEFVAAYVMIGDMGAEKMSQDAFAALTKSAVDHLNVGIDKLTRAQARTGVMQRAVTDFNATMALQLDTIATQLDDLESVDPTEAAARVNSLMTQIEAAYTLTSRISKLSLTRFL